MTMLVCRTTITHKTVTSTGLQYYCYNVVVDKYSSRDNVHVMAVKTAILVHKVHKYFPNIQQVMIGSDNASWFASHDYIPYLQNHLDTHYSFVNILLQGYVHDGNSIVVKEDIFKGLCHNGRIKRSTAILFYGSWLLCPVLEKDGKMQALKCT